MNKVNQRGITLIALIITIIVMLILVAVAVRTAVSSGLFGHASDATKRWGQAEREELNLDNQVGDLINKHTKNGIHNWTRTDDNLKCEHCNLSFTIGDYIDYKPDATSKTVTITKEESGLLETSVGSEEVIDPTSVSDQTFTQDENTYWQVLGIEDSNGDGINETLLIKMALGTKQPLKLNGASAYNNGPEIMNKISRELYSSNKYGEARSINIKDLNATLQYVPNGGFLHYYSEYTNTSTSTSASSSQIGYGSIKIKELTGFNTTASELAIWENIKQAGTFTPDGENTEERLGKYKINGYNYLINNEKTGITNPSTNYITNVKENLINIVFFRPSGKTANYWLSCRGICTSGNVLTFGPGALLNGRAYSHGALFTSMGQIHPRLWSLAVCPVVSLRFEIPNKISKPEIDESHIDSTTDEMLEELINMKR